MSLDTTIKRYLLSVLKREPTNVETTMALTIWESYKDKPLVEFLKVIEETLNVP